MPQYSDDLRHTPVVEFTTTPHVPCLALLANLTSSVARSMLSLICDSDITLAFAHISMMACSSYIYLYTDGFHAQLSQWIYSDANSARHCLYLAQLTVMVPVKVSHPHLIMAHRLYHRHLHFDLTLLECQCHHQLYQATKLPKSIRHYLSPSR